MDTQLIAPCGMNCGICLAYLRNTNICYGCWNTNLNKLKSRTTCLIRNCELLEKTESKFCCECAKFPCTRLKQLDKRYRLKYKMSMIENLYYIEKFGLAEFELKESIRWKCDTCGGMVCVHRGYCLKCRTKSVIPDTFQDSSMSIR